MRLDPEANKLEGGFQNGACQDQCPHSSKSSPKWLPPVSLCPGCLQLPPPSPRSAGMSAPGPEACEILCVPFKNGLYISHSPLGLLKVSPTGLQSQTFWGFIFPVQDPSGCGALCGAHIPCSFGSTSAIVIILPFVDCLPRQGCGS